MSDLSKLSTAQLDMAISTIKAHIEGLGDMIKRRDQRIADLEKRADINLLDFVSYVEAEAEKSGFHWLGIFHEHWRQNFGDTVRSIMDKRNAQHEAAAEGAEHQPHPERADLPQQGRQEQADRPDQG